MKHLNVQPTNTKAEAGRCLGTIIILIPLVLFAMGCGKGPIQSFEVSIPEANTIDFSVFLAPEYALNLGGSMEIMEYGDIFFNPPSGDVGTEIGIRVHTNAFLKEEWVNYEPTGQLPNGDNLPSYITTDLVEIDIPPAHNDYVTPYVYFGMEDHYYLGVGLIINVINQNFPQGLQVTHVFYNDAHQPIVGGTLFGPKVGSDGSLEVPGGVFIAVDLTNAIGSGSMTSAGLDTSVNKGGLSWRGLKKIDKKMKKALKKM